MIFRIWNAALALWGKTSEPSGRAAHEPQKRPSSSHRYTLQVKAGVMINKLTDCKQLSNFQ